MSENVENVGEGMISIRDLPDVCPACLEKNTRWDGRVDRFGWRLSCTGQFGPEPVITAVCGKCGYAVGCVPGFADAR